MGGLPDIHEAQHQLQPIRRACPQHDTTKRVLYRLGCDAEMRCDLFICRITVKYREHDIELPWTETERPRPIPDALRSANSLLCHPAGPFLSPHDIIAQPINAIDIRRCEA